MCSSKRGRPRGTYEVGGGVQNCVIVRSRFEATGASACLGMKRMNEYALLITAKAMAAAAVASRCPLSPLVRGTTTAFDNVNLLSAPRVEHKRPCYYIEKGEQLASCQLVKAMRRYGVVGEGDALMTIRWLGARYRPMIAERLVG